MWHFERNTLSKHRFTCYFFRLKKVLSSYALFSGNLLNILGHLISAVSSALCYWLRACQSTGESAGWFMTERSHLNSLAHKTGSSTKQHYASTSLFEPLASLLSSCYTAWYVWHIYFYILFFQIFLMCEISKAVYEREITCKWVSHWKHFHSINAQVTHNANNIIITDVC